MPVSIPAFHSAIFAALLQVGVPQHAATNLQNPLPVHPDVSISASMPPLPWRLPLAAHVPSEKLNSHALLERIAHRTGVIESVDGTILRSDETGGIYR